LFLGFFFEPFIISAQFSHWLMSLPLWIITRDFKKT
jgi:hypothetical protein